MAKSRTPSSAKRKTSAGATRRSRGRRGETASAPRSGHLTVRHYCQGIGDCHLLRCDRKDGSPFWMLIDCGIHSSIRNGSAMIDRIVADIRNQTHRLDVVVLTHEHVDHISGFLESAGRFKDFEVGEVWMAWTENSADAQAMELDKYKQQALAALQLTSQRLDSAMSLDSNLLGLRNGLDSLLGFSFGIKGERVRGMRDAAAKLGPLRYCEPSHPPISITNVEGLRIYVLAPSRNTKFLGVTERASEMYGVSGGPIAQALFGAMSGSVEDPDGGRPFDEDVGWDLGSLSASVAAASSPGTEDGTAAFARDHYFGPVREVAAPARSGRRVRKGGAESRDQSWRRIDLDWLSVSAELAMQLDDRINNTSLVLAFEFTDTKRVLLFTGDAQVGSWLSWQEASWEVDGANVTGPDLLARTVYYKVGHHGSHNATLKAKGLELMVNQDLAAFIPTNATDAKTVGWGRMPFDAIVEALTARCSGRVIRADDSWVNGTAPGPQFHTPSGAIRAVRHQQGLWVEFELA